MKSVFSTALLIIFLFAVYYLSPSYQSPLDRTLPAAISLVAPSPTPTPIQTYIPPTLPKKEAYTIILIGDSMTQALGPNSDLLRTELSRLYPKNIFGIFNYGFSATNILSVNERLTKETTFLDQKYPPIIGRQFDIIILESFGHNPLSQYPLAEGLALQTKTLDEVILKIHRYNPQALIVLMATIAPSKTHYSLNSRDLSPSVRESWANERIAYIENHINYAKAHNFPLINVYQSSLNQNGVLDLRYVTTHDYIHPSVEGVKLITTHLTEYLKTVIPQP